MAHIWQSERWGVGHRISTSLRHQGIPWQHYFPGRSPDLRLAPPPNYSSGFAFHQVFSPLCRRHNTDLQMLESNFVEILNTTVILFSVLLCFLVNAVEKSSHRSSVNSVFISVLTLFCPPPHACTWFALITFMSSACVCPPTPPTPHLTYINPPMWPHSWALCAPVVYVQVSLVLLVHIW